MLTFKNGWVLRRISKELPMGLVNIFAEKNVNFEINTKRKYTNKKSLFNIF